MFVIISQDLLYWSHKDGWVEFDQATRYTLAKRCNFVLPAYPCEWVHVEFVEKFLGRTR